MSADTPTRKAWPKVPDEHPLQAWCLVMQDRLEELHEDVREIKTRPSWYGLAKTALGEKGKNVPYFLAALIFVIAVTWGGSYLVQGPGFSLSTGAAAAGGPAPRHVKDSPQ